MKDQHNKKQLIAVLTIIVLSTMVFGVYLSKSDELAFSIYTANSDTYEREKVTDVRVKKDTELEEILAALVKGLSDTVFKLPMTYEGIQIIFDQRIAVVNLHESPEDKSVEYPDVSWRTGYFQGSTGGAITSVSLVETMLQKDYDGDWVDGVKFLYDGEPIEYEHVSGLLGTQYRTVNYVLKDLAIGDKLSSHFELENKTISENGRTITYNLTGDFDVNGRIYYFEGGMEPWLEILESPIRAMSLEIEFEEVQGPYFEDFRYYTKISNVDVFFSALEAHDSDKYASLIKNGTLDIAIRLRGFNSILWAESEYHNESEFVEFLK